MQLHGVEPDGLGDAPDLGGGRAGKHAHLEHARRHCGGNGLRLRDAEHSRRARHEVEPDRVGPGRSREGRIAWRGQAADFDSEEHCGGGKG